MVSSSVLNKLNTYAQRGVRKQSPNTRNALDAYYDGSLFEPTPVVEPSGPNQTKRGTIDRIFGALGNNSVVEGLYNMTDDDPDTGFWQGMADGVKYMNPLENDVSGRHTFSDVLKNVGWEDDDPDKLTLGDVGRGVVGFAGDVLLDPLSYINPYSALGKVVKGTGVTADAAKALKLAKVANVGGKLDDIADGAGNLKKLGKLASLSIDDVKDIVGKFDGYAPEEIPAVAERLLQEYNRDILRVASGGDGLSVGIGHLPFATKKAQALRKTIVSSDKLREFGDNTIAPYYNTLAKKLRTSSLGQKFSSRNQIEALGLKNSREAIAKFHTDQLLKGVGRLSDDIVDIANADVIEDYWKGLTKEEQYEWLEAYESGALKRADEFQNIRDKIADAYEKATGKAGEGVLDDGAFFGSEALGKLSQSGKKTQRAVGVLNNKLSDFLATKRDALSVRSEFKLHNLSGKYVKDMSDVELVKSLRMMDKMDSLWRPDDFYKKLMEFYQENTSRFPQLRRELGKWHDEKSAKEAFSKLPLDSKSGLIDAYAEKASHSNLVDRQYSEPMMAIDGLDNLEKQRAGIFKDSQQYKFYKRMDELNGTNYMSDLNSVDSMISHIAVENAGLAGRAKAFGRLGGEDGHKIARMISRRMEELADKEVSLGLLDVRQANAYRGRYLYHIPLEDLNSLKTLFREDKNGIYNPDILGIMKRFNKRRTGPSIANANQAWMDGEGKKIFEDALHEIYLVRSLKGNKATYGTEVQNFIIRNFGKGLSPGELPNDGYTVVARFSDLERTFQDIAQERFAQIYEDTLSGIGDDVKRLEVAKKLDLMQDSIVRDEYDALLGEFSFGDENVVRNFVPNVTMQKLNSNQRRFLELLPRKNNVNVFQISDSILDRTNVLSRTQKLEQQSSFLRLFDRFQSIWKMNNSMVVPSFHAQNSLSNAYQSFLAIGADAFNIRQIRKAADIIRLKDPRQTVRLGDKIWNYKELEYTAKKLGVLDELFTTYEFGKQGNSINSFKDVQFNGLKSLNPLDLDGNAWYQLNTVVGTNIEATQRMNVFMSALKQGQTIVEAAETVDKFLFDYGALTDFEKDVMKRVVPFYTFMRKNIPLQLEQMLERPQFFAALDRAFTNVEKMDGEGYKNENERSEWRQDYMQIPGTKYGVNWQLPYQQLDKLELNEDGVPNKVIGSLSPLLKPFYEVPRKEYAYTEIPIKGVGEYLMNQSIPTGALARTDFGSSTSALTNLSKVLAFPIGEVK